jgi:hypothetical protein
LKNDKTIIAYHFSQYYCLLQKEWRLPKIEIDWLIKVLRNGCFHNGPKQNVCLINFDKFLTNVKLFHVYIKVHNTTSDIGHKPAISNIFNTPTCSKNSANSQCKAWICKKKYHGY